MDLLDLSKLAPARGARKRKKLLGRGEASGHGKTCCRGGKGQTARTGGGVRPGFEGGQMPLYRRLPKFGFTSRQRVLGLNSYHVINLTVLDGFKDGESVTADTLTERGYGRHCTSRRGFKVLGGGKLSKKVNVKLQAVSKTAKEKIEAAGGKIEIVKLVEKRG